MATYVNGQGGTITIGSATLPVDTWTANSTCEALDVTTTGSAGWAQFIAGIKGCDFSCKTFYDTASPPLNNTNDIQPGVTATVTLPIGNTGHSFSGSILITECPVENPAKGAVSFGVTGKFTGAVTFPT